MQAKAIPNVRAWMQANRPRLIQAVLTILRAYHLAGRPKSGLPVFGRFEEWSDSIREPLVWAGFDDPLLTREAVVNDDPDREKCATLLAAWSQAQGVGEGSTLEKVIATANLLEPCNAHLKAALLAVAANAKGDMVDPNRLAWWCRKQVGRPAEGLVLVKFGKDNHTKKMLWGVEAVTVAEPAEACGPISSANAGESKTDDHTDDHHQTHGNGLEMPPHASAGSANPPPPWPKTTIPSRPLIPYWLIFKARNLSPSSLPVRQGHLTICRKRPRSTALL